MNRLQTWYAGLQPREQRMVSIGAVALAIIIVVAGILMPLQSKVSRLLQDNDTKRQDLAWMRVNADEVRAAAASIPANTGEAPVVLVDRVGRESGLATALRGTQPNGTGGVRVQLEAAPFDTMIGWLATLDRRYGFSIDSITVDRAPTAGMVNANITFSAPTH
jgi:general secretion pathway protein M